MRKPHTTSGATTAILTVLALLAGLLSTLLLASASPASATRASGSPEVHDAFHASLRIPGRGRCSVGKSDAQVKAHLRCRDGLVMRLRPCPQEDSRRCFWHAPSRGNGVGRSFVAFEGRHYFRP